MVLSSRLSFKAIFSCAVLLLLSIVSSYAQGKYALVVGNGSYGTLGHLKNPVNDARDMANALVKIGFKVDLVVNADQESFENALIAFSDELRTNKDNLGFFYYAGHGIQSKGENYLIPVNAVIRDESFLRGKTVSLQSILDLLNDAGNRNNIVLLDACRNNPFSWSRSVSRGLTVVGTQPAGSIIVYATSANEVAQDGQGDNGVFTGCLLKHIAENTDFDSVLNATAQEMIDQTGGIQHPAVYKENFSRIYLAAPNPTDKTASGGEATPSPIPPSSPPPATPARRPQPTSLASGMDGLSIRVKYFPDDTSLILGSEFHYFRSINKWFFLNTNIGYWAIPSSTPTENTLWVLGGCGINGHLGNRLRPYIRIDLGLGYYYWKSSCYSFILGGDLGVDIGVVKNLSIETGFSAAGTYHFGEGGFYLGAKYHL